ncbi:MAG TPA: glycosyltransferase family 4 protein [Beijerinckiaceae bacterium]|nr:glycosyltransferase family 4 protein [Beijerinckiaceae bacterium]
MTRVAFAVPGDLRTRTGGYGYARELIAHLPAHGIAIRHCALPGSFPLPPPADLDAAFRALSARAADEILLIDGLAFGALPAARIAALGRRIVALVHHPLGFETGLDAPTRRALIDSERAALAHAAHVVVSSETTREALAAEFDVDKDNITVAEPGTRPAITRPLPAYEGRPQLSAVMPGLVPGIHAEPPAPSSKDLHGRTAWMAGTSPAMTRPIRLLAVGSITPRKGFDVLIAALAPLRDRDWRLRIVGSPDRAPETAAALRVQIAACGLADRVDLVGELDTEPLDAEYAAADLFVLASHYEGYGMVLAEAMAHGLPIVTTTGGAAASTVPDAAALKVPPGDSNRLGEALIRAIDEPDLRRELAAASRRAGALLPRWSDTAGIVANVLHRVARLTP